MNIRSGAVVSAAGIWLAMGSPASAHRVDEYLQATRLSVDRDRIGLELDITPGVTIASTAFASIDTNGDGRIADSEGHAYAQHVLHSMVLSIDGRIAPITLTQVAFPPLGEMSLGVGTIRLRATADVPAAGAGRHRMSYLNMLRPESSVYLVNALVPADSRIHITGQRRDSAQHGVTVDYTVTTDVQWAQVWAVLAACLMSAVLGMTRWPRRRVTVSA